MYNGFRRKRFYQHLLTSCSVKRVFDIGANEGKKTKLFLDAGCDVLAIEPYSKCLESLEKLKRMKPKLKVKHAAVLNYTGKGKLRIGSHKEISTLSDKMVDVFTREDKIFWKGEEEVEVLTLNDLISEYGQPDFIKLDCEGSDKDIIITLKAPISLIEFEYTRPFLPEVEESIKHLANLGNYQFNFSAYEMPGFIFEQWMEANELIAQLQHLSKTIIHGNVYSSLNNE